MKQCSYKIEKILRGQRMDTDIAPTVNATMQNHVTFELPIPLSTITDEHTLPINKLCLKLHTCIDRGLTNKRAKVALKEWGANIFKKPKRVSKTFQEDSLSALAVDFSKAEWDHIISPMVPKKASVIRNGEQVEIRSKYLVPGDVILLEKHDLVPADIRLVKSLDVLVDNRLITGQPIQRRSHEVSEAKEDYLLTPNLVFSCTKILSGQLEGIVLRTGERTVFGTLKNFAKRVEVSTRTIPT